MSKIQKVENQPNFPQLEERISNFWNENKVFEKSVEQRDIENSYSFLDGPPFPSGMPHYGHLLMSVAKDIIPRYQTMKGKRVRRVFGWDCHGIAVEAKVNKELGISNRREIEEFGIEKYVKECRKYVENCIANWRWYIDKVGRWVDMDNPYYTMYPEYHESVLWAFKQMWDKGHIYKGKRVSLFSVETGTPVSDFEVAEANDYRETEDLSIFVKFKIEDTRFENDTEGDPVHIVAWTTTPWTIPSNTALCVNPEVDYSLVKFEGQYLIVAKNRLEYTFHTTEEHIGTDNGKLVQIIKEFKGLDLEGISYESIYTFFADQKKENDYKIYLYEGVTVDDGTGVLHVAPAFGEEDFNLGKKHGLSDHRDIDEEGKMSVGKWKGTYLRDACAMIAEDLNEMGNLLRSLPYMHRLPFYRGSEPLIYMAQDSYFINLQDKKEKMLELNQNINWVPSNIKTGRFPAIIESAPDWCISRNRYWATIMPLWRSEDGDEIVVGGFEEMMQYTDKIEKRITENGRADYFIDGEKLSAHRDKCDALVFVKDGKEYRRVQEVLDVWLDSGSAPFAEHHYPFENKDLFDKNLKENKFVNDFIVEGAGMVRAWFNVLHRVSTLVFDTNAFSNVICAGTFAGNDGRKMSKTYGNYTDPKDVLENLGGETLRLYMMGSAVMGGGEANWSDELLKEMQKNILIPIWNTYKYLSIYAELHNWNPENTEFKSNNVLDIWLKNYMDKVTLEYSNALEIYDIPASVKLIQPCIDNISSWWIRRSRDRFVKGDQEALQTLYASLVQFVKTFAPQMPFVCEEMYQNLVVNTLGICTCEECKYKGQFCYDDCGCNKLAKESVHLELYPEVKADAVDQSLLDQMELVRKVCSLGLSIRVENAFKVRQPLQELKIKSEELKELNPELLNIVRDELNVKLVSMVDELGETEGCIMKTQENLSVALNTQITPELKEEGLLNELVRQLQNFRKESGLQMGEVVELHYFSSEIELRDIIDLNKEKIMKSISMSDIKFMDDLEGKEVKIDDKTIILHVVK